MNSTNVLLFLYVSFLILWRLSLLLSWRILSLQQLKGSLLIFILSYFLDLHRQSAYVFLLMLASMGCYSYLSTTFMFALHKWLVPDTAALINRIVMVNRAIVDIFWQFKVNDWWLPALLTLLHLLVVRPKVSYYAHKGMVVIVNHLFTDHLALLFIHHGFGFIYFFLIFQKVNS